MHTDWRRYHAKALTKFLYTQTCVSGLIALTIAACVTTAPAFRVVSRSGAHSSELPAAYLLTLCSVPWDGFLTPLFAVHRVRICPQFSRIRPAADQSQEEAPALRSTVATDVE